jgi:hypothetical protein
MLDCGPVVGSGGFLFNGKGAKPKRLFIASYGRLKFSEFRFHNALEP